LKSLIREKKEEMYSGKVVIIEKVRGEKESK
jgi:hypothetical protein